MTFDITEASREDIDIISALLQNAHDFHVKNYPRIFCDVKTSFIRKELLDFVSDPLTQVRVALVKEEIVGCMIYKVYTSEKSEIINSHKYLFLEQLAVSPLWRRQGVATALLKDMKAYASRLDIQEIRLEVWNANKEALACYEKSGFKVYNYRLNFIP